jgi:putative flippase GtrA
MYKDYHKAAVAGFFTGIFLLPVVYNLEINFPFGIPQYILVAILPVIWMLGIALGNALSRWFPIMAQFSRYVAAGFLSFSIDFGIFNLLIMFTGVAMGWQLATFKGVSYLAANINAYLWNKYWVFRRFTPGEPLTLRLILGEYGKFLIVSIIGFVINVSITSFIVDGIGSRFGMSDKLWANIAAIIATAIAIVWNFTGYKLFVFKKQGKNDPVENNS